MQKLTSSKSTPRSIMRYQGFAISVNRLCRGCAITFCCITQQSIILLRQTNLLKWTLPIHLYNLLNQLDLDSYFLASPLLSVLVSSKDTLLHSSPLETTDQPNLCGIFLQK